MLVMLFLICTPVGAQPQGASVPPNLDIKKRHFYDSLTMFFRAYGEGSTESQLTLGDCIKIAEDNSNDLSIARSKTRSAADRIEEVKSAQNPQLSASAYYLKQGPIPSFTIPGFGGPIQLISDTNYDLKLTASYLISNFGLIDIAKKVAFLSYMQSKVDEDRVRADLELNVIRNFFTLVENEGFVTVAKRAISAKELQYKIAKANFDEGIFPKFEVIQASVGLKNAELSVVEAARGMELVRAQVRNLLGIQQTAALDVRRPAFLMYPTPELEKAIDVAFLNRPEMAQLDIAVDIARANVDLAANGKNPSILLVSTYDQMTEGFGRTPTAWTTSLNFQVPIFDGGTTWAKIKQAKESLTQAELARDQLKRNIALEVKSSHLSVIESRQKLDTAEANLEQAQEAYDIALVRYEEGIGTNLELDNALVNYLNANATVLSAYCEYERSWASLVHSMGLLLKGGYYDQGNGKN